MRADDDEEREGRGWVVVFCRLLTGRALEVLDAHAGVDGVEAEAGNVAMLPLSCHSTWALVCRPS